MAIQSRESTHRYANQQFALQRQTRARTTNSFLKPGTFTIASIFICLMRSSLLRCAPVSFKRTECRRTVCPHAQREIDVAESSGSGAAKGFEKLEKENVVDKEQLRKSLSDSSAAIRSLLEQSLAQGGKIKAFKPHAAAFLGYLISTNHIIADK